MPAPRRWRCGTMRWSRPPTPSSRCARTAERLAGEGAGLFRRDGRHSDGRARRVERRAGQSAGWSSTFAQRNPALTEKFADAIERESAAARGRSARRARAARDFVRWTARGLRSDAARRAAAGSADELGLRAIEHRQRRRPRRRLHDPHLPVGHGVCALPRRQEPRAGGMGGS